MAAVKPTISQNSGSDRSNTVIDERTALLPGQTPTDVDAARLAAMGYVQEMNRGFSLFTVIGSAFSLTNAWYGLSTAMVTGINAGGPVVLMYGIILCGLVSVGTAITLAELASAFPNAGGQYFWANELAPDGYKNIASYLTGWFAYWGSVFTCASVTLATSAVIVGIYQLTHPEMVIETWHVFLTYELFILVCYFFNCWGKILPKVAQCTFAVVVIGFFAIIITVPVCAPTHRSAEFVFATFINNTGWKQPAMAFIVGLINPNWSFACIDMATHLAEEVPQPERIIPIVVILTIPVSFVTGWFYVMAMMFSIQDLAKVTSTPTGAPILEIFREAVSVAGAAVLGSIVVLAGIGSLISCQTWQARLCWSFSRDQGMPGHRWLKKVNKTLDAPVIAHTVSAIINALIGFLYLGSSVAFNSMVTATITLLYVSYCIPVICLLIKGRSNIPHGPFWLGKYGFIANCVLLGWTAFTLIMYSFPVKMPVTASNMNYISAVYGVVIAIIMLDWYLRGKHEYSNVETKERRASKASGSRPVVSRTNSRFSN